MISNIAFMITNRCNSKCRYCYVNAAEQTLRTEVDPELVMGFLDKYKEAGGRSILLTGGEVLLYPGIEDVIKYAKDLELELAVFTNGLALDEEKLLELRENVQSFSISLDGPAEIHDYNRGIKGAYEQTIGVLHLFKKHQVPFSIQMTIGKSNLDSIDYVGKIAHEYGAHSVSLVKMLDQGRGKECSDKLEVEDLYKIKAKAVELSKQYKYRPYFMTHIYLEKEIQTYFKSDILVPIYWIDSLGDICLYSTENKNSFKLCNIVDYPEGIREEVWLNSDKLAIEFSSRVKDKKIISFDEELEEAVGKIKCVHA